MSSRSVLVQHLLALKPVILSPNKMEVGKAYIMAMLTQAVYIDLDGIALKDDMDFLRKKVMQHLKNKTNELMSEEETWHALGDIFIGNHNQKVQILKEWMVQIARAQYNHFSETSSHLNYEYSMFQYTTEQVQAYTSSNTTKNNIEQINTSHIEQQKQNQSSLHNQDLQSLMFNLDISQIPLTRASQYQLYQNSCENWIQSYINSIEVYRSEINLLSQQLKLPSPTYKRSKYNNKYYVQVYMRICNQYTSYFSYQFVGYGQSPNYKHGCEQAAKQLVTQIYMNFPAILHDFARIKEMKGLQ